MIRKVVLATAMIFLLIAVIPFASRAQLICGKVLTAKAGDQGRGALVEVRHIIDADTGWVKAVSVRVIKQSNNEACTVVAFFAGPIDPTTVIVCDVFEVPDGCVSAAPPQKVVGMTTLKNFFQEAGMSKKHAQELVNKTVREIKLKKPGEEGERLIRLITQQPSPTKPRKLATKWAKMKTKY